MPEPAFELQTKELAAAQVGKDYSQQLELSGGTAPFEWSLEAPTLRWLAIDADGRLFNTAPIVAPEIADSPEGEPVTVTVTDARDVMIRIELRLRFPCEEGRIVSCTRVHEQRPVCEVGHSVCVAGKFTPCQPNANESLSSDRARCGPSCGACDEALTDSCRDGACACGLRPPCGPSQRCCPSGGFSSCFDLTTDVTQCGRCVNDCTSAAARGLKLNVAPSCAEGTCEYACIADFRNCNSLGTQPPRGGSVSEHFGTDEDGCETALLDDPGNCGSCGRNCRDGLGADPHGTAVCQSGHCGIDCQPGYANVNGSLTDGCEIDLRSDVNHCGAPGRSCVTESQGRKNVSVSCVEGQCQVTCKSRFDSCAATPDQPKPGPADADGCETPLETDAHCSGCFMQCTGGSTCERGTCKPPPPPDPDRPVKCKAGWFKCLDGRCVIDRNQCRDPR